MAGAPLLDLTFVTADLAVGGSLSPGCAAHLAAAHGVGYVVDMREEACDDEAELAQAGVAFLRLPTADLEAPRQDQLDTGVAFAEVAARAGGKLLVHCQHGIGRSATLALCILVARGHAPLEALSLAKDRRERISPSPTQYEAWTAWMRRCAPHAPAPGFDAFAAIAYRHLAAQG